MSASSSSKDRCKRNIMRSRASHVHGDSISNLLQTRPTPSVTKCLAADPQTQTLVKGRQQVLAKFRVDGSEIYPTPRFNCLAAKDGKQWFELQTQHFSQARQQRSPWSMLESSSHLAPKPEQEELGRHCHRLALAFAE